MKTINHKLNIILVFVFTLCLVSADGWGQSKKANRKKASASKELTEVAASIPELSTFVAAYKASGLTDSLSKIGPVTIFAPSNAAFDSLPSGAKEDLLKPESKEQLRAILRNHIVSGKISAKNLSNGKSYPSLSGQELGVSALGGKIMVGGVEISKPDLRAADGIIHIVNRVIVPPSEGADANK